MMRKMLLALTATAVICMLLPAPVVPARVGNVKLDSRKQSGQGYCDKPGRLV